MGVSLTCDNYQIVKSRTQYALSTQAQPSGGCIVHIIELTSTAVTVVKYVSINVQ